MSVSLISLEDPAGQAVPLAPWMSPRSMGLVYGGCEILTACEGTGKISVASPAAR